MRDVYRTADAKHESTGMSEEVLVPLILFALGVVLFGAALLGEHARDTQGGFGVVMAIFGAWTLRAVLRHRRRYSSLRKRAIRDS